MGAGILPLAFHHGLIYILLGQERSNNLWSDFGGSSNKYEKPYETAVREANEELNGFLGTQKELEMYCNNNYLFSIKHNRYKSFIINLSYTECLPRMYNNNYKFIEKNLRNELNIDGLFEKKQIQWFELNSLNLHENNEIIRPHYLPILKELQDKF